MAAVRTALDQLRQLKTCFGPAYTAGKISLLSHISTLPVRGVKNLQIYHDLLLFMTAYPDNEEILKLSRLEIARLTTLLAEKELDSPIVFHQKFDQTGVAFSSTILSPSLDAGSWMLESFASDIEIQIESDFQKGIGEMLPFLCLTAEQDGLTDDRFDTIDWLDLAAGDNSGMHKKMFEWIIEKINRLNVEKKFKDYLIERMGLNIKLKLSKPGCSVTDHFLKPSEYFMQKSLLLKKFNVIDKVNSRGCKVVELSQNKAKEIIYSAKTVLAVRGRETDPVTYADKVYEVTVERGLIVYLFSMQHDRKLPIENYTGFVAYRNGVPIGYGGGWVFFDRCEIGVNIFDNFRGGENSLIFTNILRVYNQVFGIKKFVVPPYQFGEDNEEGLHSGAFWFYYKLGFISADEEIAKIAEDEFKKINRTKGYRSPVKVLKKLTQSPLVLKNGKSKTNFEPKHISIALTRWINQEFQGDESKATEYCTNQLDNLFNKKEIKQLNKAEKSAFSSWAPLLIMNLKNMNLNASEKKSIFELLKAKGSDEFLFSKLLNQNNKLLSAYRKTALFEMKS